MTELHFNFDEAPPPAPRRKSFPRGLVALSVLAVAGAWLWALWPAL